MTPAERLRRAEAEMRRVRLDGSLAAVERLRAAASELAIARAVVQAEHFTTSEAA